MGQMLVVDNVLSQIQLLTGQLEKARGEICEHVFPPEEPGSLSLFSAPSSVEVMTQFKAALDDVRHLVWLYLEAVPQQPTLGADPQRRLLARATEILGALSQCPPLPLPRSTSEHSLMDRLLQLIEDRIDPKSMRKTPTLHKNGC
jgi:hypothetical protein